MTLQKWCCKVASSLGELENTAENAWGTKEYFFPEDLRKPTVFFGLYDVRDYLMLRLHRGEKCVLWAGDDLLNLQSNFIFNNGKLHWLSKMFKSFPSFVKHYLQNGIESFVENEVEQKILAKMGIYSKIIPSFLGKVEDFTICYKHSYKPSVFVSGHPSREAEYGFEHVVDIASKVPECMFHLYGAEWNSELDNVICHGIVSKSQFNEDIKGYQCGLRLNKNDGFSEIIAKSVLMGQYPISKIPYPMIDSYDNDDELIKLLKGLVNKNSPNVESANYYRKVINNYPWSVHHGAQI